MAKKRKYTDWVGIINEVHWDREFADYVNHHNLSRKLEHKNPLSLRRLARAFVLHKQNTIMHELACWVPGTE